MLGLKRTPREAEEKGENLWGRRGGVRSGYGRQENKLHTYIYIYRKNTYAHI